MLPFCLPLVCQLTAVVSQHEYHRQRPQQAPNVEPSQNPTLEEHPRPDGTDGCGAPREEKEYPRKPHFSVKDGGTAAAEIPAPVTNTGEEGNRYHEEGKNGHVQGGMFEVHIAGKLRQEQKKNGSWKEAVVEMGGSCVEHECIVKIPAEALDYPRYRHKAFAARAAIRA